MFNIQCSMFYVQCKIFNVPCSMLMIDTLHLLADRFYFIRILCLPGSVSLVLAKLNWALMIHHIEPLIWFCQYWPLKVVNANKLKPAVYGIKQN